MGKHKVAKLHICRSYGSANLQMCRILELGFSDLRWLMS